MRRRRWPGLLLALLLLPLPAAAAGPTLQERIQAARPGDTLVVAGGRHPGPLVIDRPLRLLGEGWPAIDGAGAGTVVRITAPGVELRGFRIGGSGRSLDQEDSGVYVEAPGAVVAGNILTDVLFGIVAKGAHGTVIRGNQITGKALDLSQVGDGIRVWYSDGAQVLDNTVRRAREILVESSRDTAVAGNQVTESRQGLHLMRAENIRVEANTFAGNSVGAYAMYVQGMVFRRNRIIGNRGPSGYGLGLKEGEGQVVENNLLVRNNVGVYVDNSPLRPDRPNTFRHNVILGNDAGILFTPATTGNRLTGNDFLDNHEQVGVAGGGRLGANDWTWGGAGNYWSDYAGYDADGDGTGDYPHRAASLFETLTDRHPAFRWYRFSPAALAVDLAARAFPAVAPEPKLEDRAPRMAPHLQVDPLPPAGRPRRLLLAALLMLGAGLGLGAWALRPERGWGFDPDHGPDEAVRALPGPR